MLLGIELGQLYNADMRKILRSQSQKAPEMKVNRLEIEFVLQIDIFALQLGEVALLKHFIAVAHGNGVDIQQSCLPKEQGFNLKKIVAVVRNDLQWQT